MSRHQELLQHLWGFGIQNATRNVGLSRVDLPTLVEQEE